MTKMTYAAALSHVLTTCEMPEEVRAKLVALSESLVKKASAEKKPTKTQQANEDIKVRLMEAMQGQDKLTVTDIQNLDEEFKAMSNQKVAALVRQLVKDGKLQRLEEGRKAYFKVA